MTEAVLRFVEASLWARLITKNKVMFIQNITNGYVL